MNILEKSCSHVYLSTKMIDNTLQFVIELLETLNLKKKIIV